VISLPIEIAAALLISVQEYIEVVFFKAGQISPSIRIVIREHAKAR